MRNRTGRSPARRTSFGAAMLLAAVLLVSGEIGAVQPAHPTTLKAPYRGTIAPTTSTSTAGCGAAVISKAPAFDFKTGVGGFSDNASATSCKLSSTNSGASDAGFSVTISVPFRVGMPGVFVNLSYAVSGHLKIKPGVCRLVGAPASASCSESFGIVGSFYALWEDLTAGTSFYLGSSTPIDNLTQIDDRYQHGVWTNTTSGPVTSGTISVNGSASWSHTFSKGLVSGDRYAVCLVAFGDPQVFLQDNNAQLVRASAEASVTLATRGGGLNLTSIVET